MSAAAPTFAEARLPVWKPVTVAVLTALTLIICWVSRPANTPPVSGVNLDLPEKVGFWYGSPAKVSAAEKRILPPDTVFSRKTYTDVVGDSLLCSIVLSGADARSIHRPERCLPGQGWSFGDSRAMPITLDDGRVLTVQVLDLYRNQQVGEGRTARIKTVFIYWFVGDRLTTHSNLDRTVRGFMDRVFLNREHRWAYISISANVTDNLRSGGKDTEQTLDMLVRFIQQMAPHLLTAETLEQLPEAGQ